jgi:hypothetical protein
LRYAEKSINFWVDYGNFNYTLPEGLIIDHLDTIWILNAEDLNTTDFACYMGTDMKPMNLSTMYNKVNMTLAISPMPG